MADARVQWSRPVVTFGNAATLSVSMDSLLIYVATALASLIVGAAIGILLIRRRSQIPKISSAQTVGAVARERQFELSTASLDSLEIGLVICDPDGEVVFRNRQAASIMNGRHQDALAAKALEDLIGLARLENYSERTFELYGPPRRSYKILTKPLHQDDRRVGFLALLEDISDKRHLDEVRRDFVANVSHELKTPIGAIQLLAETLEAEDEMAVIKRLSNRIQLEAIRVGRIIEDLLDLSRIESEETALQDVLSVAGLIDEAASRMEPSADVRGVSLDRGYVPEDVYVLGERRQLISAIYNLLDNAVKYSDPGERVSVSATNNTEWVDVTVKDEGIGIPSRDVERIFERFYRVDQTRSRATGGTGLGLAIVRHVVNNHKGRIIVESREGVGSTFTLRLPLADPEEP